MWLFSKPLTARQEADLLRVAATVSDLCSECREGFQKLSLSEEVRQLYTTARDSLRRGTPLGDVEHLVRAARDASNIYYDHLQNTYGSVSSLSPADWYPKRFHKAYDSLVRNMDASLKAAGMVLESLEPPALEPEPGKHKLNMFVSGLDLLAILERGFVFPTR